jgi:hypothetical protein
MVRMLARLVIVLALIAACSGRRASEPPIAGLPPIDRPWTTAQLAQAAAALDELCTREPLRLPVLGSRTFARLIAADNRSAIVASPLAARVADHARHTGAVLQLYGTYLRCGRPVETLAVNAALLEGYAASMPDGDALIAALPPDSPEAAGKRAGRDQKIAGLRGGIVSTIDMLADPQLGAPVPPEVATRLGAAIGQVRAALPPGSLDEPLAHLDDAVADALDPARKTILIAVRDAAH